MGFVNRSDYRRFNGLAQRRFRPSGVGRIQEIGPRIFFDSYWDFTGFHESERYSVGGEVELRSGARVRLRSTPLSTSVAATT